MPADLPRTTTATRESDVTRLSRSPLSAILTALAGREVTASELLEDALSRLGDHPGVLTDVLAADARSHARAVDRPHGRAGADRRTTRPLAGILVSVKANLALAGLPTTAGSPALGMAEPAECDADSVARARTAGAIVLGRSVMTELAESAVGLVPPLANPIDPRLVTGGSSSGDAVAVAEGLVGLALATDEGGSARVPAAFCGLVGFRPSRDRLPRGGLLPLSPTLDGVAILVRTAACLRLAFHALAIDLREPGPSARKPRIGVPRQHVWDEVERSTAATVRAALDRLDTVADVVEVDVPWLTDVAALRDAGDFAAAETAAWAYGLPVDWSPVSRLARERLARGRDLSAVSYLTALERRRALAAAVDEQRAWWDALAMPTTPLPPPLRADISVDRERALNPVVLRNTRLANLLDWPAVSLPLMTADGMPCGLMLTSRRGRDKELLALAELTEACLVGDPV